MRESGQVLAARYVLLRKLGAGRWGEVWLARDRETGRDHALKILGTELAEHPELRGRFVDAARLQQRIRHPRILACEEIVEGEVVFAVHPYAVRGDLTGARGRPWTELLPVLDQVAEAVAALHAERIVHRDLKPSNVLQDDAGGVLLSDLGIAAPIGEHSQPGSPFNQSPQQLAGEPASIADDVYGFGALAYELLSGYPPLYPDPSPDRIRDEPPLPVRSRATVPGALEDVVLACLAKSPEARPADLAAIRIRLAGLVAAQAAESPSSPRVAVPAIRPPQDTPAPIEPRWQRATTRTGPSASDLRGQGFRRGVLAAAFAFMLIAATLVFFALPRWVAERQPVATSPSPVTEPKADSGKTPERDLKRLAEAKQRFDELHPTLKETLARLEARAAREWGGETYARGRESFDAADKAYGDGAYDTALTRLEAAAPDLKATEQAAAAALRAALDAGQAALSAGASAPAEQAFAKALRIQPDHAAAKRGLTRARRLDEVRRLTAEAVAHEREGRASDAAAAFRKALALDPDAVGARAGLARVQSAEANAAFAAAMSQGLDALARRDFPSARAAFERAQRMRPGAPEAADGLAQVARAQGDESISGHLAEARGAEAAERWQDAVAAYRKALAVDAQLLAAQQGLERAEPRAMLDAELDAYLARPERLFSAEVRAAAQSTLARARSISAAGPRLAEQITTVSRLINSAEIPVPVALSSDNQTEVTINRVGKLGAFEHKDVELLPGRYTVVGTRSGYRDVRRELTVLPGQPVATVAIRCEEPI